MVKPYHRISDLPDLSDAEKQNLAPVTDAFAFRVTPHYARLIRWDNPADPLRRIVIPTRRELETYGEWDASGEAANYVAPGCQHKYRQTAVLLVAKACHAYCRFCFRKRLFQPDIAGEATLDVSRGVAYIASHPEITNVLLTGGDPLVLATACLAQILDALRAIPHVRIIRIGTKALAFQPARITDDPELVALLGRHSWPDRRVYVVTHFDHPRELSPQAFDAAYRLQAAGCILTHQCPLLAGVNDDPGTLAELLESVAAAGIAPYYIFQNRPVRGNAGFVVPMAEGYRIVEAARTRLSGLAKRFRYVMSHSTGKVEILAVSGGEATLKYHEARDPADDGRVVRSTLPPGAAWLDDLSGFTPGLGHGTREVSAP